MPTWHPPVGAEALRDGASRFETTARKLKRNMWWKNARVRWPGSPRWAAAAAA